MNDYKCFCRAPLERTELHDAAERGEVKRVQKLLSTGSLNINSRTVIVSGVGLTLTKVYSILLENSKICMTFISMTFTPN